MKLEDLNTNKYFTGIMMIVLNLGSRFLVMELSDTQTQLLSNKIIRRFVVFTVVIKESSMAFKQPESKLRKLVKFC